MNKERVEKKKDKETNAAFLLLFPSFILAVFAVFFAPLGIGIIAIAIAVYQWIMVKKFIQDYYKKI